MREEESFDAGLFVSVSDVGGKARALKPGGVPNASNEAALALAFAACCSSMDRLRCSADGVEGELCTPWSSEDVGGEGEGAARSPPALPGEGEIIPLLLPVLLVLPGVIAPGLFPLSTAAFGCISRAERG